AIRRRFATDGSVSLARHYVVRGMFLGVQTRYRDALPFFEKAAAWEEAGSTPELVRAETLQALARCLQNMDRYKEAIGVARKSLALREASAGADSAEAAKGHFIVGFAMERVQVADARTEMLKALDLTEKHLGQDNADVANIAEALGRMAHNS